MKGWNEYFSEKNKVNEELQHELGSDEIYASDLGLLNCKIVGATIMGNGIKLDVRDSSSQLGFSEITIKNGKIDISTRFYNQNGELED